MSVLNWPSSWLDRLLGRSGRRPAGKGGAAGSDSAAFDDAAVDARDDARYGSDEDPEAEWVTVYDAPGIEAAHVIKALLESEDLPVMVRYDTLSVVYGMTAGFNVEVQVPRALRDRALAILEERAAAGPAGDWDDPDDEGSDVTPGTAPDDDS